MKIDNARRRTVPQQRALLAADVSVTDLCGAGYIHGEGIRKAGWMQVDRARGRALPQQSVMMNGCARQSTVADLAVPRIRRGLRLHETDRMQESDFVGCRLSGL